MRRFLLLVTLLATVASCTGSESGVATTAATAVPGSGTAPPTTSSAPFPPGEPLDFVLLADSGGGGVAEPYAARAAEALGREIRVRDLSRGGATARDILSGIQHGWADAVAGAEVIVFYVNPAGFEPAGFIPCIEALDEDADIQSLDPPTATTVEDWQGYRDTLDEIYDDIWLLRAGQPTIIRAYGVWLPFLAQWREMGIETECVTGEEAVDRVRKESAEAHGAVFVSIMDVTSGPAHDRDPVALGLISDDGMHPNSEGVAVLVDALAAAGFESSEPPG